MATAGDRYEQRTGNIWSYAHRGDMTGLKAAVARGVDVDLVNTVGWTACHAAAAGGQTKALRYLVKTVGADVTIKDKGGNLPVHHAAKNGHLHALRTLRELGADVTRVRLSQAKGKAVREFVVESYRKAGKKNFEDEADDEPAVGYARKQSKSTAFWGPRRTPISCAIKKKIIKDKRKIRKEKQIAKRDRDNDHDTKTEILQDDDDDSSSSCSKEEPSYHETVQQIKRNRKHKRRQRQQTPRVVVENDNTIEYEDNRTQTEIDLADLDAIEGLMLYDDSSSDDDDDDDEDEDDEECILSSNNGQFAALALGGDNSDSE